jgi:hypothetical protein
LFQNSTGAEDATYTDTLTSFANNTGINVGVDGSWGGINLSGASDITYSFRRAPSTFDETIWQGGSSTNKRVNHNLGVVPELIIVRSRGGSHWAVYFGSKDTYLRLNTTTESTTQSNVWGTSNPTTTDFGVDETSWGFNGSSIVAYLWATNAGVTKVGTYTGNGSSQTINCGFTGGARFVMIKATSTTGNWLVADSARGIVSGNDPALYLNSTSAEVTGFDWIDADNSGFIVNETSTIAANTNGVQYLFLAYA